MATSSGMLSRSSQLSGPVIISKSIYSLNSLANDPPAIKHAQKKQLKDMHCFLVK